MHIFCMDIWILRIFRRKMKLIMSLPRMEELMFILKQG